MIGSCKGSQAPLAEHEADGIDQQQDESIKQTHDFGTISSKGTLSYTMQYYLWIFHEYVLGTLKTCLVLSTKFYPVGKILTPTYVM